MSEVPSRWFPESGRGFAVPEQIKRASSDSGYYIRKVLYGGTFSDYARRLDQAQLCVAIGTLTMALTCTFNILSATCWGSFL